MSRTRFAYAPPLSCVFRDRWEFNLKMPATTCAHTSATPRLDRNLKSISGRLVQLRLGLRHMFISQRGRGRLVPMMRGWEDLDGLQTIIWLGRVHLWSLSLKTRNFWVPKLAAVGSKERTSTSRLRTDINPQIWVSTKHGNSLKFWTIPTTKETMGSRTTST